MEPHIKLINTQSPLTGAEYASMQHIPYHEAIKLLMYTVLSPHPNITYAVSTISHFASNPGMPHWEAVYHIYRYLISTQNLHLTYGGTTRPLEGYMDADGIMAKDWKAISSYAFLINGGAMFWALKKQEIVFLSMIESEYIAAIHAMKEALWLCLFIGEVLIPLKVPITLFSDNQSTITLAKKPPISHLHEIHQHSFPFHMLDS